MSKYIVIAHDDEGNELSMTLEYDNSEMKFLKSWVISGDWEAAFWRWIWRTPPVTEQVLKESWDHPIIREIKEVPEDLSFAHFWDLYDYKVGDRKKTMKAWDALCDADKMAALAGIPRYKYWLSTCTTAQAHAVTFLNQRRYENEYKVKK